MIRRIRKIINEAVRKAIFESQMDNTDITDDVLRYLSWSQMGQSNPMFSVEASKLHNKLMNTLCLNHENEEDRRTFASILSYIKILEKRAGIKTIKIQSFSDLLITTNLYNSLNWEGEILLDVNDFENGDINYIYNYGIVYKTMDGVIYGGSEYHDGSCNGSSGYYTTSARMSDEIKQHIYSLGLVPALLVTGSYHENFLYSVGVLPEMVSKLKEEDFGIHFDCKFDEY